MNESFSRDEQDLIHALRNYRKSYPKSKQLLRFAKMLFDELATKDYNNEEEAPN